MEKLPPSMRLIISKATDKPEWDLDVLLKAFDSEIEAREHCEPIGTNPSDSFTPKRPLSSQRNKGKDVPTGATLTNQSEQPVSCTFCKQSHPSASCGTVTDISARRNLLKQQGRCFVCLRRNHLARNCSPKKCVVFPQENIICQSVKMPTVEVVPQKSNLKEAVWWRLMEANADLMRTSRLQPFMWTRTRQSCYKQPLRMSRGFINCILW